jgi:hypothetical protein
VVEGKYRVILAMEEGEEGEEGEEENIHLVTRVTSIRSPGFGRQSLFPSSCRRRGFVCHAIGGGTHTTGPPNPGADFIVVEIVQGIR